MALMIARFTAGAAALVLMAGAAHAQPVQLTLDPALAKASRVHIAPIDLTTVQSAGFTDAEAKALRTGVARTSVDQSFSQGLTASLGFLCDPHAAMQYDVATARPGADPQGKFLGAKLSLAFK
jgi:hypothetical protein